MTKVILGIKEWSSEKSLLFEKQNGRVERMEGHLEAPIKKNR